MVKGVSRQVIVVHAPEEEAFEQAIFILKDGRDGVTDEALLREAKQLLRRSARETRPARRVYALLWSGIGAAATGLVWLLYAFL